MKVDRDSFPEYEYFRRWNSDKRAAGEALPEVALRQRRDVEHWLAALNRTDLEILDVGSGSGWLVPTLAKQGNVTGTDLVSENVEESQRDFPQFRFIAGDFANVDLPDASFDVIVTLEVLAHVADQDAFLGKIARLLRPGGHLMLAIQNRTVLKWFNNTPPAEGQRRQWSTVKQLRNLVRSHLEVIEFYTATPTANRWPMRLLASRRVNRPIRAVFGDSFERLKERAHLGWTIMLHAVKPNSLHVARSSSTKPASDRW